MLRSLDAIGMTKHLGRDISHHSIPIESGFASLRMTSHTLSWDDCQNNRFDIMNRNKVKVQTLRFFGASPLRIT
jgi:hypothetical protein